MHAYDIHQSVWSCLTLSPDLGATTLFSAVAPYWYGSEDGASFWERGAQVLIRYS